MTARPYALFDVALKRKMRLSPSLCRFTFADPSIANMRTLAPDQRIKVFFPNDAGKSPALSSETWLADYQAMNPDERPPRRTYTIRALRDNEREVDIDFVLHGATGPASRWAISAEAGARLQIVAPNRAFDGDPGGYEWRPPHRLDHLLLLADETALPAVSGILEGLAASSHPPVADVYLEVPQPGDRAALPSWPFLRMHWCARNDTQHAPGSFLIDAARKVELPKEIPSPAGIELSDIDVDHGILWETQAPSTDQNFYGWVAGEAGAVKTIRRILLKERGLPRSATNLMGYWRLGQVLE